MEGIRCGDESRALPLLQPLLLSWTACSSYLDNVLLSLPIRSRLLEETIARTLPLFTASMGVSWSRQTTNARLTLENPPRTRTQLADVSVDTRDFTITRIPAEGERKELSLPIIDNTRPTAYWLPRSVFQELLYNEVPSWLLLLFFFLSCFLAFPQKVDSFRHESPLVPRLPISATNQTVRRPHFGHTWPGCWLHVRTESRSNETEYCVNRERNVCSCRRDSSAEKLVMAYVFCALVCPLVFSPGPRRR